MTYIPDPNLRNLHLALQFGPDGAPELRVQSRVIPGDSPIPVVVENIQPIPVTIGSNVITITGNVNVGTTVEVSNIDNTDADKIVVVVKLAYAGSANGSLLASINFTEDL
jgi:hypothetical protein